MSRWHKTAISTATREHMQMVIEPPQQPVYCLRGPIRDRCTDLKMTKSILSTWFCHRCFKVNVKEVVKVPAINFQSLSHTPRQDTCLVKMYPSHEKRMKQHVQVCNCKGSSWHLILQSEKLKGPELLDVTQSCCDLTNTFMVWKCGEGKEDNQRKGVLPNKYMV